MTFVDIDTDHGIVSLDHVGILCENLERSLDFYQNVLGMSLTFSAQPSTTNIVLEVHKIC